MIVLLFCMANLKAAAQDTILTKDLNSCIGRKVKLIMYANDFDLRKEYIYSTWAATIPTKK